MSIVAKATISWAEHSEGGYGHIVPEGNISQAASFPGSPNQWSLMIHLNEPLVPGGTSSVKLAPLFEGALPYITPGAEFTLEAGKYIIGRGQIETVNEVTPREAQEELDWLPSY